MIELIVSIILCLAHLSFTILHYDSFNIYDLCYFSSATLLSGVWSYRVIQRRPRVVLSRYELGLFVVSMIFGLTVLGVRSIWIDEYSQFRAATLIDYYHSLSNGSGIEQQPPLGYVVSWLAHGLFGDSVFSLRIFSVLCSSLGFVYTSRILKKYQVNRLITSVALIFFITRLQIFDFFVEGRPYALAIFFSLMVLDYYIDLYHRSKTLCCVELASLLFFLVNSIGMQAQIFAASLFLGYAILSGEGAWKNVLKCNILAAILFMPSFINIVKLSEQVSQFKDAMTFSKLFENLVAQSQVMLNGLIIHGPIAWEIWTLLFIFLMGIVFKLKQGRFILLVTTIFTTLFLILYVYFINWTLYLKYFVLLIPLVVIMAAIGLQIISERIYVVRTKFNQAMLGVITLVYSLIILTGFTRQVELFIDNRAMPWKSVYGYLEQVLREQDTVYFLTFNEAGEWSLVKPVGPEFYLKKFKYHLIGEKYIPGSYATLPDYEKSDRRNGDVYLISPFYWSNDHLDDESLISKVGNLEVRYIDGVRIYHMPQNGQTDNERLISLLENALELYGDFSWTFSIRMSLIRLYSIEGNFEARDRELAKFQKFSQPKRRTLTGMTTDREEIIKELIPFLKKIP